jgi:hypothetical protein
MKNGKSDKSSYPFREFLAHASTNQLLKKWREEMESGRQTNSLLPCGERVEQQPPNFVTVV